MPKVVLPEGPVVRDQSQCPQCPNWGESGSACSACGSPLPFCPATAQ